MEIFHEQVHSQGQAGVPVTIIKLVGEMDGSNFREAVNKADEIAAEGACNLLVDLSEMNFMSSAGLAALYHMAVHMRKLAAGSSVSGYQSLDEMKQAAGAASGPEKYVKLLNPQPRVQKSLEQVGYDGIFEIFTDRDAALAAFS